MDNAHSQITAVTIAVEKMSHAKDLPLPDYQTNGAAGMDLCAALGDDIVIAPGDFTAIPTGLAIALPAGLEAQIRPRSGLAFKHGITVLNSPGTIDSDYRGEIKIALINHGKSPVTISHGMRIAQMVIAQTIQAQLQPVDQLDKTERGASGFGSTGIST